MLVVVDDDEAVEAPDEPGIPTIAPAIPPAATAAMTAEAATIRRPIMYCSSSVQSPSADRRVLRGHPLLSIMADNPGKVLGSPWSRPQFR